MHTLLFLNPGHFHAALTLRRADPRIDPAVRVYAEPGPELDAFLALVAAFNGRAEAPTAWRPVVEAGPEPLHRMVAGGAGDAVVLAGRNRRKMAEIHAAHAAGFAVLADKPWVAGRDDLPLLREAMAGPPLVRDIMTERHEVGWRLAKRLIHDTTVFGGFRSDGDAPALELHSVHQLYKTVNGAVLRRPVWYFDVREQGDGIVDIPSHLADLAQWLLDAGPYDYARDVVLLAARRWATDVPAAAFERITGAAPWPEAVASAVEGGVLRLLCNGEIDYRLRSLPVRLHSKWHLSGRPAADSARGILRGTRAELTVEQGGLGTAQRRVFVRPVQQASAVERALREALAEMGGEFPGLVLRPAEGGWVLEIPPGLVVPHEAQFALVLDGFLEALDAGTWPAGEAADIVTKYTLLGEAWALASETGSR